MRIPPKFGDQLIKPLFGDNLGSRATDVLSVLSLLAFGIISVYVLVTFSVSSQFISILGVVVQSLLTILLISIYLRQNRIIEDQKDVQKEQAKLTKAQYVPYVVGPFDFEFELSESEIRLKLANTGGGVAQRLRLYVEAEPLGDYEKFDIDTFENPVNREGDTSADLSVLYPNEGRVEFSCSPWVELSIGEEPPGSESLDTIIQTLIAEGVSDFRIEFYIRYEDRFGNKSDPFGNNYEVFLFSTRTTHNQSVEDVFDAISV